MSYESTAQPIKLGYLFDFRLPEYFPRALRPTPSYPNAPPQPWWVGWLIW